MDGGRGQTRWEEKGSVGLKKIVRCYVLTSNQFGRGKVLVAQVHLKGDSVHDFLSLSGGVHSPPMDRV
jgi:hypothetical protein